jgi:hypothetical protein
MKKRFQPVYVGLEHADALPRSGNRGDQYNQHNHN